MLVNESVCMSLITDSINGADVQAETDGHEGTSLMGWVDGVNRPLNNVRGIVRTSTIDRRGIDTVLNGEASLHHQLETNSAPQSHQVSVQCCALSGGAVWCAVWRRQVLLSCHVC